LFLAHIRAAIGSPVQQTNCHPFRYGRWLFVHNGMINGFQAMRRELLLQVDPSLFSGIAGSTDSELLFHLALTLGLEDDPLGSMERAVGLVEEQASRSGVEDPVQVTVGARIEIPESTGLVIEDGAMEQRPFTPVTAHTASV
jgi:predicted glutamine amidotransferase